MKKFLKLFFTFLLVFAFSFTVFAEGEEGNEGGDIVEPALVTIAPVVSVKGNNDSLILTWDSVENATSYVISRSTDAKKGFKTVKTVTTTTYTDKKLTYGKTYYYKVKAVGVNSSKTSSVVSKKVSVNKVSNVVAKPASTSVKITWDKNSTTGYYVYKSTDKKKWTKIATIKKNSTTSYKDKKVKAKTTYYYQVQAYKKVNSKTYTGKKSDIVQVKTLFTLPTVKMKSYGLSDLYITIKPISKASFYEVQSAPSKDGVYSGLGTTTNSSVYEGLIIYGLYVSQPYVTQYYRVRACQSDDYCSSWVYVSGQAKLGKPEIYSLRGGNKYVNVMFSSYDSYDSDVKYEIYRATSKKGKYKKITTQAPNGSDTFFLDKKVSNGKTYYYKIRAVKTINDKKKYSSYSKIRSVKTGKGAEVESAKNDIIIINKEYPASKKMFIEILSQYYGYTESQATKGIDKAKIDFKKNCLKLAKEYLSNPYYGPTNEEQLRSALSSEGFTKSQIDYALSKVNINWHDKLTNLIKEDLNFGISKQMLLNYYTSSSAGYTEAQVLQVINELNVNFNEQALKLFNYYKNSHNSNTIFGRNAVRSNLTDDLFTESEINYALENGEFDWAAEIIKEYTTVSNNIACSRSHFISYYKDNYGFTDADIEEAITRLNLDFAENALTLAKNKVNTTNISKEFLLGYLVNTEGFTAEEANAAANYSGFNFDEECSDYVVANFMEGEPQYTLEQIRAQLKGLLFTDENIEYAFANTDINNHVIQG